MSSVRLLDKTRKIGKLLHSSNSGKFVFNDICKVMQDVLSSSVRVISRKGKILGISEKVPGDGKELIGSEVGSFIDPLLNERMLAVLSTKETVNLATLGIEPSVGQNVSAIVTPIEIAGERLGTLFLYRSEEAYSIDDIILCEYGSNVIGLEMLRAVSEESAEEDRKISVVRSALGTLSYSEQEAIKLIFQELKGTEGILVASKIADQAGITRSVIVNALRKFESAGIIESRSSGMKGTYIRVQNEFAVSEVKKLVKPLA